MKRSINELSNRVDSQCSHECTGQSEKSDFLKINITSNEISKTAKKIFYYLILLISSLIVTSAVGQLYRYFINDIDLLVFLAKLFYVDRERNIPTAYSSIALMLCCILLALITVLKNNQRDSYTVYWRYLSVIFLFLSVDEIVSIHERFGGPVKLILNIDAVSPLYFAWVVPGIIFVFLLGLIYLRFILSLPTKTRFLFTIAGITFLVGAIGMEMVSGWYASSHGGYASSRGSAIYVMIVHLEEFLEMLGIVIFIYALLQYIGSYVESTQIYVGAERK